MIRAMMHDYIIYIISVKHLIGISAVNIETFESIRDIEKELVKKRINDAKSFNVTMFNQGYKRK